MSAISSQALPRVPQKYAAPHEPSLSSSSKGRALLLQSNTPCSYLPIGLSKLSCDTVITKAREFTGGEDLRGMIEPKFTLCQSKLIFLSGIQVIVYAPDEKSHLNDSAQRRVKNFVYSGGGLVVFEWVTYHIERKKMTSWADFIPITRTGTGTAGTVEYAVSEPSHPIAQGLPAKFAVLGGFSIPAMAHKGHVVLTCGDNFPAGSFYM